MRRIFGGASAGSRSRWCGCGCSNCKQCISIGAEPTFFSNSRLDSQAGSTSKEADSPGARLGWPTKLSLNTAIPLSMLGLRVTRDLVPHYASPVSPGGVSVASATTTGTTVGGADAATGATATTSAVESEDHESGASATLPLFVESERSYGERLAGESAFSRDLRRGLLIQPVLPKSPYMVEAKKGGETLLAAGAEEVVRSSVAGNGAGGSRMVGLSNDAIPVIDLTWDDDEVMLPAQGALQDGGAERPIATAATTAQVGNDACRSATSPASLDITL